MTLRKVFCSPETALQAKQAKNHIVRVYSMFPIDRADCLCASLITKIKSQLGQATDKERRTVIAANPAILCPRNKTGMRRYRIYCGTCKQIQGYLWATSPALTDWCDFHYVQWTYGDFWRGCLTPHISPVSEELCFECCCGNDTRDFRANMTLPQGRAEAIEKKNSQGRKLGELDAKFFAVQIAQ